MLRRETRKPQNQTLREAASSWRNQNQEESLNLKTKRINPQQFRRSNSHLLTSRQETEKRYDLVWDENGCLIHKPVNVTTKPNFLKRSTSVLSMHSSILDQFEKERKNKERNAKPERPPLDIRTHHTIKFIDAKVKPITRSKVTRKRQQETTSRLSTRVIPVRQKSVQPKKLSSDFEGFMNRQTQSIKMHNKKHEEPPQYKFNISEGSKKVLRRSQSALSHSVYDIKKKEDTIRPRKSGNSSVTNNENDIRKENKAKPKIIKREPGRLQNMDPEMEKIFKEDRRKVLIASVRIEDGSLQLPIGRQRKPIKPRKANNEPYIPKRLQPDSVFETRRRIQEKINEMKPIIDANEEDIKWSAEARRKSNKKRNYLPNYIRSLSDMMVPDFDDPRRNERRAIMAKALGLNH